MLCFSELKVMKAMTKRALPVKQGECEREQSDSSHSQSEQFLSLSFEALVKLLGFLRLSSFPSFRTARDLEPSNEIAEDFSTFYLLLFSCYLDCYRR